MLRRSRTFVVATIVLLISFGLLASASNTPPKTISAATKNPAEAAGTAESAKEKVHCRDKDCYLRLPIFPGFADQLTKTLSLIKANNPVGVSKFDLETASYLTDSSTSPNRVVEIAIGLCNSGAADLSPDATLPSLPGGPNVKVVGAAFNLDSDAQLLLVVYPTDNKTANQLLFVDSSGKPVTPKNAGD